MAGRMAGPIKTKLGIGTHVDPENVLVKVEVMWCHLVNANKTPDRPAWVESTTRYKYAIQRPAGPRQQIECKAR